MVAELIKRQFLSQQCRLTKTSGGGPLDRHFRWEYEKGRAPWQKNWCPSI